MVATAEAVSRRSAPPAVAAVLAAAGAALLAGTWTVLSRMPGGPRDGTELVFSALAVVTMSSGLMIAWRVRRNAVGPLVVAFGALQAFLVARSAWYWGSFLLPDALPQPSPLARALVSGVGVLAFVVLGLIVLLFPTGRLASRQGKAAAALLAVAWILFEVGRLFSTSADFAPYQGEPPLNPDPGPAGMLLDYGSVVLLLVVLLATILLGLLRVRRARGVVRQQLKWVLLGACLFLFYPFVCGAEVLLTGVPTWPSLVVAYLGMLSLPVGMAIGMLRYDLFDVDRALAATVTWAIVATGLALAFAAVIVVGGALAGAGSPWVAAVATAACALALAPGYRLIHRTIGARLYPARRAGLQTIRDLGRAVTAGDADPGDLRAGLATALRDDDVRIGYVVPESGELVDAHGAATADEGTPITAAGERIGVLHAPGISGSLRRELAEAAIPLVTAVRLRLHLTRSLAEVEASRARLVAAEDTARRRFERDLHDGAQQRLVSLGVSLRLAQRRARTDAQGLDGVLDAAVAELTTAIAELRQLAHGIRPSVLDDGLPAAVTALARTVPLPVELTTEVAQPVPDPVATTAYYVVAESLANAVKHAHAERIRVLVAADPARLHVAVHDDGRGGADAGGSGIAGLADRVAALGGRFRLRSPRGEGTTVEVELPCAS